MLGPILAVAASRLGRTGAPAEAARLLDETLELLEGASGGAYPANPVMVRAIAELGARERYRALLEDEPAGPWIDAALAMCDGDCVRAADIYEGFGAVTQAAEMRLVAARDLKAQGDVVAAEAQAAIAAAFFAARGASARVREVEQLLAATA